MCRSALSDIRTYRELRGLLTRRQIESALRTGSLVRVRRGVYADASACAQVIAAAAHGGALACQSAARHLGLWVLDDSALHVWMHRERHQYPHDGCTCTPHWDDGASTHIFELPSVPRILAQIYHCQGDEAFFVVLESARQRRLIDAAGLDWLRRRLSDHARELIDFSRKDAGSGLESLVRLRCRCHDLDVRTQVRVAGTGDVDLLVDGWLIIEADGKENHDGESKRHKDLLRDANSAMWGYVTLRFDYAMIIHDWDLVERAILSSVARYGPR